MAAKNSRLWRAGAKGQAGSRGNLAPARQAGGGGPRGQRLFNAGCRPGCDLTTAGRLKLGEARGAHPSLARAFSEKETEGDALWSPCQPGRPTFLGVFRRLERTIAGGANSRPVSCAHIPEVSIELHLSDRFQGISIATRVDIRTLRHRRPTMPDHSHHPSRPPQPDAFSSLRTGVILEKHAADLRAPLILPRMKGSGSAKCPALEPLRDG